MPIEPLSGSELIELLWLEMKTYLDFKSTSENPEVDIEDMARYLHKLGYRKSAPISESDNNERRCCE